jgi:hypothetical protein
VEARDILNVAVRRHQLEAIGSEACGRPERTQRFAGKAHQEASDDRSLHRRQPGRYVTIE